MKHEDTVPGNHYWLVIGNQKCIGLASKCGSSYYLAGPWECKVPFEDCQVIEEVSVPYSISNLKNYY